MRLIVLLVVAACTAEAAPPVPTPTVLTGTPMLGPYATAEEACRTATPCGFTVYDERSDQMKQPPDAPDCSAVAGKADPHYEKSQDSEKPVWLAKGAVAFAPVICSVPRGIRHEQAQYYLYAQRKDGWWRSAQPIVELQFNEKYCTEVVNGVFKTAGDRMTFRFQGHSDCPSCSKQGSLYETLDGLLVADLPAAPATPVTYPAIVTGEHIKVELDGEVTEDVAALPECQNSKKSVVMAESWPDPDTLVLKGAKKWRALLAAPQGLHIGFGENSAASTAGTYTFKRP